MTSDTTKAEPLQPSSAPRARLFADWCDSIEVALRERVRTFVVELINSELPRFVQWSRSHYHI